MLGTHYWTRAGRTFFSRGFWRYLYLKTHRKLISFLGQGARLGLRTSHSPLDNLLVDVDLELDLLNNGLLVGVRAQRELLHLLDATNDGKRASEGLLGLVDVASSWLEKPTDEEELKELVGILEVLEGRSGRDELGRYEVW